MDILNWLYLKTQGLVRTQVNDAKTDLVTLGAEVPFTTRGDGYQAYAMPLADAVHAGCVENNTYRTGIFDLFPFYVTPSMIPTCTRVEDTPAFPTLFASNLVGYKIGGAYDLNEDDTVVVEYLGTVESTDGASLFLLPFKSTGTATAYVNVPFPSPFVSAFANGAIIQDDNGDAKPAEIMTIALDQFSPIALDIYIVASSATAVDRMSAEVAFEFEFLIPEGREIKFTIY